VTSFQTLAIVVALLAIAAAVSHQTATVFVLGTVALITSAVGAFRDPR
jgi:hypothetical protein